MGEGTTVVTLNDVLFELRELRSQLQTVREFVDTLMRDRKECGFQPPLQGDLPKKYPDPWPYPQPYYPPPATPPWPGYPQPWVTWTATAHVPSDPTQLMMNGRSP